MSFAPSPRKPAATLPGPRSLFAEMSGIVLGLVRDLSDRYRPERHYMRGPGPKWRMKQAGAVTATVLGEV